MSILQPARFNPDLPNNNPDNDPPERNMNQNEFVAQFQQLQNDVEALNRRTRDGPFHLKNSDITAIPDYKGETNLLPQFI